MGVTITDIANITGFSISTVSKALSNSTDISENSKAAILKCAVESGYIIGRKKSASFGTIAAVVEGMDHTDANRFEYQMLFGFQLAAASAGYEVSIVQRPIARKWSYAENIFEKNYAGAFLMRLFYMQESLDEIKNTSMPIVMFDYLIDKPNASFVGCDNIAGIGFAVQHLASLGHQRVAFYGGTPLSQVSIERKEGFIKALRENGLQVHPEIILESDFNLNFAHKLIPKMIEYGATAIVCASDLLAKYAIDEIHSMGLKVPDDISVTGFDNVPLAENIKPKLTTVSQNCVELGRGAFYMLKKLIKGVCISKMFFRPSFVVRDSSAPPRQISENEIESET